MFKVGDKVQYIGADHSLKKQYAGTLEIWEIAKQTLDGYACLKPGRTSVTSWIKPEDLKLIEKAKLCTKS
jgi:hypothetical protein